MTCDFIHLCMLAMFLVFLERKFCFVKLLVQLSNQAAKVNIFYIKLLFI